MRFLRNSISVVLFLLMMFVPSQDECEPVEATTIEKSQEVVTTTKKRARRASEIVIAKVEHIEKTQKELIEEKRLAMERKHTQDINDANEERE